MNTIKKTTQILCIFLLFSMNLNADTIADPTIVWDKDEVLQSIDYKKTEKLKAFISVATKEQLNEVVNLSYNRGNASLLGIVMEIMFQQKEFKNIVNLMIEKGSNVNGIENDTFKPLTVAIKQKNWEMAKKLLDTGASIDIEVTGMRSYDKLPLFYMAIENKDWKPFLELSLNYNPKLLYTQSMKEDGESYLKTALDSENPSVKLVKYLLSHGEKADKEDGRTTSPYYIFLYRNGPFSTSKDDEAYRNRLAVFNLLLDTGINPFLKSNTNCLTPLSLVQNDIPTLNRLLEKGLKPNDDSNCYHQSNLSVATMLGNLEVFKILLEKGGDLFQGRKHHSDAFHFLISDVKNDTILEWMFANKKEAFETLSSDDAQKYLNAMIVAKKDGAYFDIINVLLKSSSNYQKTIDEMIRVAIGTNQLKTAEYFSSLGAKLIDHSCKCQQTFWNKDLDSTMIDWLLAHNVNPFLGAKSIEEVVSIDKLSLLQFEKLIEEYPKDKQKKKLVQKLFKVLLESYNLNNNFLLTAEKIALLKTHGLKFNESVDIYMAKHIEKNNHIKILWLLTQGARMSAENQEHYIDSPYMRGLIDKAGNSVTTIDFYPQNEEEKVELDKIFSNYKEDEWYLKNIDLFVKPNKKVVIAQSDINESSVETSILNDLIVDYKTRKIDPKRYTLWGIIGLFYIFLFVSFISLIVYFISEKKEPSSRKVVLSKMFQIPILLMLVWWVVFIINAFSLDYLYLQNMKHGTSDYIVLEWENWLLIYLIILLYLLGSLAMLFRESFLKKTYYSVTFYGKLTFFILSLLLPFLLMLLSDLHDGYQFSYIGGLL